MEQPCRLDLGGIIDFIFRFKALVLPVLMLFRAILEIILWNIKVSVSFSFNRLDQKAADLET